MSNSSTLPTVMEQYAKSYWPFYDGSWRTHPVVVEEYVREKGWVPAAGRKRVSVAYCRQARRRGVTSIAVAVPGSGRVADFAIEEVCR